MAKAFIDDTNLTAIADAIRAQNGSTDTYLPSEMGPAIVALPVLDTSDATATASDMADGVTAYVNGEKVTGIMPVMSESQYTIDSGFFNNTNNFNGGILYVNLNYCSSISQDNNYVAIRPSATICIPGSYLGDATAENVVSGNTFTSVNGLKIEGTLIVQKYYTGTDEPDASLGSDGDLYLKTT